MSMTMENEQYPTTNPPKTHLELKFKELNLSITTVAKDLFRSRNLVYKWLRDPDSMTVRDARILADYLDCPLSDVVIDLSSFCFVSDGDGHE